MASELYVETLKGLTSGANANKVIIPAGQTLDASAGGFTTPAGHVIQVVHTDVATPTTSGSVGGVFANTGLTASITPSSTSSKILVLVSAQIAESSSSTVVRGRVVRTINGTTTTPGVVSDGTSTIGEHTVQYQGGSTRMAPNSTTNILDTPNTTSTITYTYQIAPNGAAVVYMNEYTGYVNSWSGVSHMTLMEIAA